jgi:hypothetical protein
VGSSELATGSVTRSDASRGTLPAAYGRINVANLAEPAIAPGAVGIVDLDDPAAAGNVLVTFDSNALPGGSVATCTIIGTAIAPGVGGTDLSPAIVTVNPVEPGFLDATTVQVQTHSFPGGMPGTSDRDFFIQVNCPPG